MAALISASVPMPDPAGVLAVAGRAHPFQVVMVVLVARVAAFAGDADPRVAGLASRLG